MVDCKASLLSYPHSALKPVKRRQINSKVFPSLACGIAGNTEMRVAECMILSQCALSPFHAKIFLAQKFETYELTNSCTADWRAMW